MLRDEVYLLDIADSAKGALAYVSGKTREQFFSDRQCQDAVIRRLEIVGEAARRVSQEGRSRYSDLPWREMVSMRNRMIHEYDDVDLEIVWDTVQVDLPQLVQKLRNIIPPGTDGGQ